MMMQATSLRTPELRQACGHLGVRNCASIEHGDRVACNWCQSLFWGADVPPELGELPCQVQAASGHKPSRPEQVAEVSVVATPKRNHAKASSGGLGKGFLDKPKV